MITTVMMMKTQTLFSLSRSCPRLPLRLRLVAWRGGLHLSPLNTGGGGGCSVLRTRECRGPTCRGQPPGRCCTPHGQSQTAPPWTYSGGHLANKAAKPGETSVEVHQHLITSGGRDPRRHHQVLQVLAEPLLFILQKGTQTF